MTSAASVKPQKDNRLVHGIDNYVLLILIFPVAVVLFVGIKLLWSVLGRSSVPEPRPVQREQISDECPICMDSMSFGIATNCGHVFCASCFCRHWKRTLYGRQISCPMCRGHVRTLTRQFTEAELESDDSTRLTLDADIDLFNRWHSGLPVPLLQQIRDVPILVYSLLQHLFTGEATSIVLQSRVLMLGLGAMFYVLSPFDLIPEMVAGIFGLVDDFLIILLFGIHVYALYRAALQR